MKGAHSKRKRGGVGNASNDKGNNQNIVDKTTEGLDVNLQIEKVKNGSNEELARRKAVIERETDKKIAAADRFRKLQIKNINDLYEFEVMNFQAQKEKTLREIEEKYLDELQAFSETHKARGKLSKSETASSTSPQTNAIASASAESVERSLRSVGAEKGDKERGEKERSSRKKQQDKNNPLSLLEKTLDEKEIKSDFSVIVRDLETKAENFNKRKLSVGSGETFFEPGQKYLPIPQCVRVDSIGRLIVSPSPPPSPPLSPPGSLPASVAASNSVFVVGDCVCVCSLLSGKRFDGIVALVDSTELVLRTARGPRLSFPLHLLASGRVLISMDSTAKYDEQPVSLKVRKIIGVEN